MAQGIYRKIIGMNQLLQLWISKAKSINIFKNLMGSSLAGNITKVYAGNLLSKICAFLSTILIIRHLSVQEYAQFLAFITIFYLFPSVISSGINLALIRFSSEHFSRTGERYVNLYLINFFFQISAYIILCLISYIFLKQVNAVLFGSKDFSSAILYGLVGGGGYLILQIGISIYQSEEKFNTSIILGIVVQFLKFIVILGYTVFAALNFVNATFSFIFAFTTIAILIIYIVFKEHNLIEAFQLLGSDLNAIKIFLTSSAWLIIYHLNLTILQRIDVFMLANRSTKTELANYGVALQYYSLALMVLGSINSVLLPRFSKVDMQDVRKQREFFYKWIKTIWWIIIPIILLYLVGKPLFVFVNGAKYEDSYTIFGVFSIGIWLSLSFSPLVNILIAQKSYIFLFSMSSMLLIIAFLLHYLLVPLLGGIGASIVTVTVYSLLNVSIFLRLIFFK